VDYSDSRDSSDQSTYNSGNTYTKKVLLSDSPGNLVSEGRRDFEYEIAPQYISRDKNSKKLAEENVFSLSSSVFSESKGAMRFKVTDEDLVDHLLISFNAPVREGILIVKLNDKIIFQKTITHETPSPIKISKDDLKLGLNELQFSVSSSGFKFWKSNNFEMEHIIIYADVVDTSKQSTLNKFYIPKSKIDIESAKIKFVPECEISKVGKLKVRLNGHLLSQSIPECGVLNTIELDPSLIISGMNSLEFETDSGSYLIDQIKLKTVLREKSNPTYYIYIDESLWEDIQEPSYIANLSLDFLVPEDHYIDMKINVNNEIFGVYEYDKSYSSGNVIDGKYNYSTIGYDKGHFFKVIDSMLQKGNNVIRLEPQDDVDIINVKLKIDKIDKYKSYKNSEGLKSRSGFD